MKQKGLITTLLRSRIIMVALVLLTVLSAIRLTNEINRRGKINAEIVRIQSEISKLEGEQRNLSGVIDYFSSDYYLEEQARKQLSLVKPGETTVIIEDTNSLKSSPQQKKPLVLLWWDYFFKA